MVLKSILQIHIRNLKERVGGTISDLGDHKGISGAITIYCLSRAKNVARNTFPGWRKTCGSCNKGSQRLISA